MKIKNLAPEDIAARRSMLRRELLRLTVSLAVVIVLICSLVHAQAAPSVNIDLNAGEDGSIGTLEMLFLLTALALAPSMLVMMTSFTRIIIVLSFLRNALGTQQSPPNQVLTGLALFLTLFIMFPVFTEINEKAIDPFTRGEITQDVALDNAVRPLKSFMLDQIEPADLDLFLNISGNQQIRATTKEDFMQIGLEVIIPSFITSELKRAFTIGFMLFIPFLIIDIVVSSTLMSMGMVMLPPTMIALPFKIMMFVMVDGWGQLISTLVAGFH